MGLGVIGTAGSLQPSGHPRPGPGSAQEDRENPVGSTPWDWLRQPGLSAQTPCSARDCTPLAGWVLRATRAPAAGSSKVETVTGWPQLRVSLRASCLSARGPGTREHGRSQSGTSMSCPRSPNTPPQAPRPALGLSGMQAPWLWGAAWRLASCHKKLWCRLPAVVQEPCGFEGAAPRGLCRPPTGPAAGASASPLRLLCPRASRSEGLPDKSPPPFTGGELHCEAWCCWALAGPQGPKPCQGGRSRPRVWLGS